MTSTSGSERAFLLTRQWRDGADGVELVFWARGETGPVRVRCDRQEAVFFIERRHTARVDHGGRRRPLDLTTLGGAPVDGLYFPTQRALKDGRTLLRNHGLRLFESDLKPADRYLMERFVTGGFRVAGEYTDRGAFREYKNPRLEPCEFRPKLRVASVDIETAGFEDRLYSIGVSTAEGAHVFLVRSPEWEERHVHGERLGEDVEHSVHADETALLEAFFSWLAAADPDVLIGWNVIDFDLHFLERACERLNLGFAVGRGRDRATLLAPSGLGGRRVPRIPGRAVLDGIDTMKTATWNFEDFSLESVSRELLGRGKLVEENPDGSIEEIRRMYRDAPWELARYNLEDCRLVEDIFEKANLLEFAMERAQLTGLAIDRVGGSVAAFDNLYLPRLHRKGRVAGDVEERSVEDLSPGGYVLDSEPGLFANVLVLDFKSLYPSIIRTFLVDPLGLAVAPDDAVPGFKGGRFSRDEHILPGLIESLWKARDKAKAARDEPTSRAIKILMNSFYGVLGTTGCRFFDARLASSVTMRGHEIIRRSREWIEARGLSVIYGDTDSLFVHLDDETEESRCQELGSELATGLNAFWREEIATAYGLESFLEVEYETHYVRFFMPTVRGSELGSKKRYAGLVRSGDDLELRFTGLESVRSDWTPLARDFQREVFRRVFHGEPYVSYVKEIADDLFSGRRDTELVYRKRVRRKLEDYKKNVPPHVQAARKSNRPGRWVRYVMTVNGPEPLDQNPSRLDYQHYLDRQLAPAADGILQVDGTSVAKILDAQMSLF